MTCYAVIDTNVLVSALISNRADAATVQLVGRVISGGFVPVYSDEIMFALVERALGLKSKYV